MRLKTLCLLPLGLFSTVALPESVALEDAAKRLLRDSAGMAAPAEAAQTVDSAAGSVESESAGLRGDASRAFHGPFALSVGAVYCLRRPGRPRQPVPTQQGDRDEASRMTRRPVGTPCRFPQSETRPALGLPGTTRLARIRVAPCLAAPVVTRPFASS